MSAVAVIPARGGSKRIPRKNIRIFRGRPMIAWPIESAQKSGLFDRIIVSTDDPEIAEIALREGAEVPFLRDEKLADDHAGVTEVVQDALRRMAIKGEKPDLTCLVYATAPMLRAGDLAAGLEILIRTGADFALAVSSFASRIDRALAIEDGKLKMRQSANRLVRSQDLPEAYHDAGQFCWGKSASWLSDRPVFEAPTVPVILPRIRVQDIDTIEDRGRAEVLARVLEELDG